MTRRRVGDTGIKRQPKRKTIYRSTGTYAVEIYSGQYADLKASKPAQGDQHQGTGLRVEQVTLDELPGGEGLMTLELSNEYSTGGGFVAQPDPIYELDWEKKEISLFQHPRYITGGDKALDADDIKDLKAWLVEEDTVLKKAFKYNSFDGEGSATEVTLSANAQDCAAKLDRDRTVFVYVPVLSKKTWNQTKPTGAAAGTATTTAPDTLCPSGYAYWYKSVYKTRRNKRGGHYEITEKWIGLKSIDTDLVTVV